MLISMLIVRIIVNNIMFYKSNIMCVCTCVGRGDAYYQKYHLDSQATLKVHNITKLNNTI